MKRWALILLMLCTVSVSAQYKVHFAPDESSEYASSQLQHFLALGGVTSDNILSHVFVGNTPYLRQHYGAEMNRLCNDGYLICGDGKDVCLYGKGEKGTLYAVYAFLERLGYRMYTPDAVVVPDLSKDYRQITAKCRIISNPAFEYREVAYYYPNHSQLYADWHHVHTVADRNATFGMFVHTFGKLLPPDKFYGCHPEWYSLNGGRRMRDGQLCLSNPEVMEVLCERLADMMAAMPTKKVWSVSPNDNYNACECAVCRRLDSIYGGKAGTLIWFVNQVARRFPDKTISTLAYQYTRKAPASVIKPEPNVQIMLCPIESGRQAPIPQTDPAFRQDMTDWAVLTNNIFLWDYVVQFRNFWNPFPNLHVLQPNLQYFKSNGARMMFEQATGADNVTSWMDIRCYMIAKLMWDPYIDIDSVMADFYQGYYGEAGRYVKEIVDTMTAALVASGQTLNIYGYPVDAASGYLHPRLMRKYDSLMTQAYNHCPDDATLRGRLRFFQLSLDFATVELQSTGHLPTTREELTTRLVDMTATMAGPLGYGVPQMMEMGISPMEYREVVLHSIDKNFGRRPCYPVSLRKQPTAPYTCQGAATLTDGRGGIMDYRHDWLGFWGDTLDAVVTLGDEPVELRSVSVDFYSYPLSWIFSPERVTIYVSVDAVHWDALADIHMAQSMLLATPDIQSADWDWEESRSAAPPKARYLRVEAVPLPEIPAWHRAAGQRPWIFVDEIVVN